MILKTTGEEGVPLYHDLGRNFQIALKGVSQNVYDDTVKHVFGEDLSLTDDLYGFVISPYHDEPLFAERTAQLLNPDGSLFMDISYTNIFRLFGVKIELRVKNIRP